jgi:uncharacterized membrane protein YgcG
VLAGNVRSGGSRNPFSFIIDFFWAVLNGIFLLCVLPAAPHVRPSSQLECACVSVRAYPLTVLIARCVAASRLSSTCVCRCHVCVLVAGRTGCHHPCVHPSLQDGAFKSASGGQTGGGYGNNPGGGGGGGGPGRRTGVDGMDRMRRSGGSVSMRAG